MADGSIGASASQPIRTALVAVACITGFWGVDKFLLLNCVKNHH